VRHDVAVIDPEELELFRPLDRGLDFSLARWKHGAGPVTLLFSGGVDSGLLAWELRERVGLRLLTVGIDGAADLAAARSGAAVLGLPVRLVEVTPGEVREVQDRFATITADLPPVRRAAALALGVGLARAETGPVLCGQGADELFLGYAHFAGLTAAAAGGRSESDLRVLTDIDGPCAARIARSLGHDLVTPYLEPEFVRAALGVPVELRMPAPVPKALFRRWARHRGLPAAVADRPKRALQYGSGIARVLARHGAGGLRSSTP
jgi:asparagine synthase (glutamine-hydrolysing)